MNSQAKRSDCIYAQISDIAAFLEIAADPLALTCDPCAYFAVANRCLEAETEHFIGPLAKNATGSALRRFAGRMHQSVPRDGLTGIDS